MKTTKHQHQHKHQHQQQQQHQHRDKAGKHTRSLLTRKGGKNFFLLPTIKKSQPADKKE
jgi:hypothetical protein